MSPSTLQAESTPPVKAAELSTQNKADKINGAVRAYDSWRSRENVARLKAAHVEQTAEEKLGERLTKEAEVVKGEAAKNFDAVSDKLVKKPEDDADVELSKFNATHTLAKTYAPFNIEGLPEKTLKLLKSRPDLLEDQEVSNFYARILLGIGQQDQDLPSRTVRALKDPAQTEAIANIAVLEIAEQLSEADPKSQIALLKGFIDGVSALNGKLTLSIDSKKLRAIDKQKDGYPLDRILSIPESGYLGLTVLKELSENKGLKTDTTLSLRGRANMLGSSFSLLLRSLENAEEKKANPAVKTRLIEAFAGTVDNLLGDSQTIREIRKDRNHPFYPIFEILNQSVDDYRTKTDLLQALNKRDLAIEDRRDEAVRKETKEKEAIKEEIRKKTEEENTAKRAVEERVKWEKEMGERLDPAKAPPRKFLFFNFGSDFGPQQVVAGGMIQQLHKEKPQGWEEKVRYINGLRQKLH